MVVHTVKQVVLPSVMVMCKVQWHFIIIGLISIKVQVLKHGLNGKTIKCKRLLISLH